MSTQTATLTFDLTDPEGERALRLAINAPRMMSVLWDFQGYLRDKVKYCETKDLPDIHEIRQEFHALLSAEDINIYE
jgi:hypothetical protein